MKSVASKVFTSVFTVLCGWTAFAEWSWSGKSGGIVIDENATVTDADKAVVEALTGIHINDGVTLTFNNQGWLQLSAVLTGDGAISVGKGGAVAFSGNSPDYTGAMVFLESKIYVSHSNALGSGKMKDGTTQRIVRSDGSYHSSARPLSDGLCFADGVTCQPGIAWYGDRSSNTRGGRVVTWFSSNMTDHVTFNGPLYMNKSGNVDYVRLGNYTLNGEWGLGGGFSGGTCALTVHSGCEAYVNGGWNFPQDGYSNNSVESGAKLHLNSKIRRFGSGGVISGSGTVICDQVDVLPPTDNFALGSGTTLDLNDKDQSIALFGIQNHDVQGWKPKRGEAGFATVTSATPATLTVTGTCNQSIASKYPFPVKFRGKASLTKTNSGTFTIGNVYSDTEGTLTVTGGKVKFDWQAGWAGDVVATGPDSAVVFADGATLNKAGTARVLLSDGAKLEVSNGVSLVCTTFKVDDEPLPPGTYTEATEASILGDGEVVVLGTTCVWKGGGDGWSDSANWENGDVPVAGSVVQIPSDTTVEVTDDDLATVAGLVRLQLDAGSRLELRNTAPWTLSAQLLGSGSIGADKAGAITFAGNSADYTGAMAFTNTTVVVTSRHGLGGPTASVLHWTDASSAPTALLFRGNGLTNDVPLQIRGSRNEAGRYFTDSFDDPWVQNGQFEYVGNDNGVEIELGAYTFKGFMCVSTSASVRRIWLTVRENCVCDFSAGRFNLELTRGRITAQAGSTVKIGGNTNWNEFFALTGNGRFVFSGTNPVASGRAACFADKNSVTTIDLNGCTASTGSALYNQNTDGTDGAKGAYAATADDTGYAHFISETPATVVISYGADRIVAAKYSGRASLERKGTGVYTIMNQYSDTTGTLSVTKGTVAFDAGAGWGGDISVADSGVVSFLKNCPQNSSATVYGNAVITGTGKINVAAGVRYNCLTLKVGGVSVPQGTYSISALKATYGDSYFSGSGRIRVGQFMPGVLLLVR